eukprot:TRINITY_DN2129_c0_g1_i4.p1 TRINITY_DN2129_c0_g1~~TRINITY_DN2129_c0_g1_i4.p1  ORF type:complete len:215 (-),score=13.49 TRINITY_DN2129_c0_g1_i4:350-946(-)
MVTWKVARGCNPVGNYTALRPHLQVRKSLARLASVGMEKRHVETQAAQTVIETSAIPIVDYFAADDRPIILFDGVCNLCNGGVNIVLDWDTKGVFRMAALQSNAGRNLLQRCGRSPDDISSMVLVENNRFHIKSEAVLRIGQRLNMPLPLLAGLVFPIPLVIRDAAYDQMAINRYNIFGKRDVCRANDERFKERFIQS